MNILEKVNLARTLLGIWGKIKKANKEGRMEKLKSRKFLVTVITMIVILINKTLELGIDTETITRIVALVIGYDVSQALVDYGMTKK